MIRINSSRHFDLKHSLAIVVRAMKDRNDALAKSLAKGCACTDVTCKTHHQPLARTDRLTNRAV